MVSDLLSTPTFLSHSSNGSAIGAAFLPNRNIYIYIYMDQLIIPFLVFSLYIYMDRLIIPFLVFSLSSLCVSLKSCFCPSFSHQIVNSLTNHCILFVCYKVWHELPSHLELLMFYQFSIVFNLLFSSWSYVINALKEWSRAKYICCFYLLEGII